MNFPKHIQDAPTPRTDAAVSEVYTNTGAHNICPAKIARQLERQLIWAEEVMAAVETSEKCPNCDDVGWFIEWSMRSPGAEPEPQQCQCEFCETNPKSRFKALTALSEYKQGTKV